MAFELEMLACAREACRVLKREERYEMRVQRAQIATIHKWQVMPPHARSDDMRSAVDYRDFEERLWAIVIKKYDELDPDCIELLHDMARCRAELSTDYDEED